MFYKEEIYFLNTAASYLANLAYIAYDFMSESASLLFLTAVY